MATITMNIPDDQVARIGAAFGGTANVKPAIVQYMKGRVADYEAAQARINAAKANENLRVSEQKAADDAQTKAMTEITVS